MAVVRLIRERRIRGSARRLNRAVAALPLDARRAMLEAVDDGELIIGAYTDRRGRACPMLAAHRRGARTDVGDFPRAWDAFGRTRRPRLATPRELEILRALLEEGVAGEPKSVPGQPRPESPRTGTVAAEPHSAQPREAAQAGA
jgi:hypothetical protein